MSDHDLGSEREEQLLRAARPVPDSHWVRSVEDELFPPARRRSWSWSPRLVGASVAAGALASVLFVATLVGGGPLSPDGSDEAAAEKGCQTVYVTKAAPVGEVVKLADGTVTVETTRRPVTESVRRCTGR